jgi:hypothetical protein
MDEDDIISWQEFVDDPSVSLNTRRIRKMVIGRLAKANGFESPTLLLDKIRLDKDKANTDPDKLTPYRASRKYIFGLIAPEQENGNGEKRLKIGSVAVYRSQLPSFFKSVLGEHNFSDDTFNRMVKIGDVFVQIEKRAPSVEELKHLLAIANPRDRALLGVLTTGMPLKFRVALSPSLCRYRGDTHETLWTGRKSGPYVVLDSFMKPVIAVFRRIDIILS